MGGRSKHQGLSENLKIELTDFGALLASCSEGGYSTLYFAGYERKLLPNPSESDLILTQPCYKVFIEEIGHAFSPLLKLAAHDLSDSQWELITHHLPHLMKLRLKMRNEQFDFPVAPDSTDDLINQIEPITFYWPYQYVKAELEH